eukprot:COSAG01_NODE_2061_length_8482_cov_6.301925_14_plen_59_part_00
MRLQSDELRRLCDENAGSGGGGGRSRSDAEEQQRWKQDLLRLEEGRQTQQRAEERVSA